MTTYSCAVFLLKNKSKKVVERAEELGITIKKNTKIIAFSFHSYDEIQLKEISDYLTKKHSDFNGLTPSEVYKERSIYLKKIKISGGFDHRHISRMLLGVRTFKKLIQPDTILAGLQMELIIMKGVKGYDCIQEITKNDRRVYAIKLGSSIQEDASFIKSNPHWNRETDAFYIGQTAKKREERYMQHMAGIMANRYVRKYGLKPFEKADSIERLVAELSGEGVSIKDDGLRHYQALYYERKLTLELIKLGYAAYSK